MTAQGALQAFFESFGLNTYHSENVPSDCVFPYMTWECPIGYLGAGEMPCTVNMWFYSELETEPNAKAKEFADLIGRGGRIVPFDDGAIWIKRGSPFIQSITDTSNTSIKRRYINLSCEFITA